MFNCSTVLTINLECAETASSLLSGKDLNHNIILPWHDSPLSGFLQPSEFRLTMLYDDGDNVDDYKCLDILPAGSPPQRWLDYIEGVSPNSDRLLPLIAQTVPGSPEMICVKSATGRDIHQVPCLPPSPTSTSKQPPVDKELRTVPDVDNIATKSEVSDSDDTNHIVFSSSRRRTVNGNECEAEQSYFVTPSVSDVETSDTEEFEYAVFGSSKTSTVGAREWEPSRSVNSCSLTSDHVVPDIEE